MENGAAFWLFRSEKGIIENRKVAWHKPNSLFHLFAFDVCFALHLSVLTLLSVFFCRKTFHSITNPFECRSTRQSSRNAAKENRASNKMAQRKKELYRWQIHTNGKRNGNGAATECTAFGQDVACDGWLTKKECLLWNLKSIWVKILQTLQRTHKARVNGFSGTGSSFFPTHTHTNSMYKVTATAAVKLQTQQCLFYDLSSFRAMFPSSQPFSFRFGVVFSSFFYCCHFNN